MAFSENLQYLRKKNKITQEELADEINVTRQSVSKWETGEAYPDTDKLILLCDKFNLTMDELVRGDVQKDSENIDCMNCDDKSGLNCSSGESSYENFGCNAKKRRYLCTVINSAVMLCALIIFLTCGFVWNLWNVGWVAFIYAFGLSSGINGIVIFVCYNGKKRTMILQAVAGSVNGFVMLMCTAVYLTIGMSINLWHPTWVIFVVGAVVCAIIDGISNMNIDKK